MAHASGPSGKTSSPSLVSVSHGRKLCDAVYAFHEPQSHVDVEIVFIHGLQFDGSKEAYWKTWWARDGSQDNCWPQTWLAEEFPHARILSLSYDANVLQTSTLGRMDPFCLGESLVQEMTFVGVGQHDCPVLFVCHGFGGLVAKQIVVIVFQNFGSNKEAQSLLQNLRGFYFYATPHGGVQVKLAPWSLFAAHGPCMRYLKVFSPEVGRLNFAFEQIHREVYNNEWIFYSAIEMQPTVHGRVVVPEASARQVGGKVFSLSAGHFDICRPQSKLDSGYQFLTKLVLKMIKSHEDKQHCLLDLPNGLVGLDDKHRVVCEKLCRVSIFGLVGMGGIGKTTISKFVYNSQAKFYDKTCFLQDVRSKGVASVQKELLLELCGIDLGNTDCVSVRHLRSMQQCIMERRVLLVIDDVGDSAMLKALQVPTFQRRLSSGSRVIVTCRNRQVLENHVGMEALTDEEIMDVDFLNDAQALELFRYHAFCGIVDEDDEMVDFECLCMDVAKACCGLPLSLEVIGQHLRKQHVHPIGIRKGMWEEALWKLHAVGSFDGGDENEVLWKSLKISYDDLSSDTKSMFLDFACFFCEKTSDELGEQSIGWIWNSPIGLENLLARSLIKVGEVGDWGRSFTMHDQLRDMGRRIVKDLSMKGSEMSLKNMSRLWEQAEVVCFLAKHEGSGVIEGISLQDCRLGALQSQADLGLMQESRVQRFERLRLLDLTECRIEVVEFCLRKCWKELSWLCLDQVYVMVVPHALEAIGFCTGLRVLQMRGYFDMVELPASIVNLVHLLELDLSRCERLRSLPREIGHLNQLKRLQLFGCHGLEELPSSVSQLIDLEYIGLRDCSKLVSLVEFETQMDHLYKLDLGGCCSLQAPFKSLGKLHQLRILNMESCEDLVIENLVESFGQLSRLVKLNLTHCGGLVYGWYLWSCYGELALEEAERLWALVVESFSFRLQELHLPAISQARFPTYPKLKVLEVWNGFRLEDLPASLGDLIQLESLKVCDSPLGYLRKLPDTLCNLVKLEVLDLSCMWALDNLPDKLGHLSSLKTLRIHGMTKMEELPTSLGQLSQLGHLELARCENLKCLPESFTSLTQLSKLALEFCDKLLELPTALGQLSQLKRLSLLGCVSLKRLPDSSTSLTRLSDLNLSKCDALEVTSTDQEFLLRELEQCGCRISLPWLRQV